MPKCNLFGYGQVESPYGSGEFYRELEEAFEDLPNLALSEIRNKDGIYDSIKEFLGPRALISPPFPGGRAWAPNPGPPSSRIRPTSGRP